MIYGLDKGKIWDATSKLAKLYSVTEYVASSEKWQESKNQEFIMHGGQKTSSIQFTLFLWFGLSVIKKNLLAI